MKQSYRQIDELYWVAHRYQGCWWDLGLLAELVEAQRLAWPVAMAVPGVCVVAQG